MYNKIIQALKAYYGVDDDSCVHEIIAQTDDVIADIARALEEADNDGVEG